MYIVSAYNICTLSVNTIYVHCQCIQYMYIVSEYNICTLSVHTIYVHCQCIQYMYIVSEYLAEFLKY
jgi:hypothetical protein